MTMLSEEEIEANKPCHHYKLDFEEMLYAAMLRIELYDTPAELYDKFPGLANWFEKRQAYELTKDNTDREAARAKLTERERKLLGIK